MRTVIGQETNHAVLIRLKDPSAVARAQGATAAFATQIAPAMIEGKVYSELAKQLKEKLRAQNIDADVSVVEPAGYHEAQHHTLVSSDLGYAIGGAGIIGLCVWLFSRKKGGK